MIYTSQQQQNSKNIRIKEELEREEERRIYRKNETSRAKLFFDVFMHSLHSSISSSLSLFTC
jgi:hypothetical protein